MPLVTVIGDLKYPLLGRSACWLAGWIVGLRRISLRSDAACEVVGVYLRMFASDSPRAPRSVTASAVLAQNSECIVTFLAETSCLVVSLVVPTPS